jgi:(p)ppGpp synthase/HD superfamily hydrolase
MASTMTPAREGTRIAASINNARIPTEFKNEPSIDWSNPENTRRMRVAIEKVRNELGREYDLVIGGRRVKTAEKTESLNPAKPSEIVGVFRRLALRKSSLQCRRR